MTGSPLVGRFGLPEHIDFVRIPGMIKKTNEEYLPLSIKINPEHALDIRKNIIKTTTKSFQPQLFIVDKEPLGLKKEILPTLKWIKRHAPGARTILGLRDIMDDASVVIRDWQAKNVYHLMDEMYDEIWVYGLREIYDPIAEYGIPDEVSAKMTFTGYIPRRVPGKRAFKKIRKKGGIKFDEKMVAVTAGGGGDGFIMMEVFLTMLEKMSGKPPFKTVFVTGPFMPPAERDEVTERARRLGIRCWHFYRRMEEVLAAADVVVSMGGYNTVCELLTLGTVSLIIPP